MWLPHDRVGVWTTLVAQFMNLLHGVDAASPFPRLRCYSCMSEYYQAMWLDMGYERQFQRPLDFTNKCRDPGEQKKQAVLMIECESICVKLEETIRSGGRVGVIYIRNCLDNLFKYGYNRTSPVTKRLEERDMCTNTSLASIASGGVAHRDQYANICSCRTDACNGARSNSNSAAMNLSAILAALFASLLFRLRRNVDR